MAQSPYDRIKTSGKLPTATGVALRLLELTQDDDARIDVIATTIQSDPALSARLLKLVNSPLAGLSRQVASVARAVAMLGLRSVSNIALTFSLVSGNKQGSCSTFPYDDFWAESLARATAARQIMAGLRTFSPDEAFTCGLLSQIGRLGFATACPDEYAGVLRSVATDDPRELIVAESATFGMDHSRLSACMMNDWHIPEVFRLGVSGQYDPDDSALEIGTRPHQLARTLHFSWSISRILTQREAYREDLSALVIEANRLGITPDVYHEVFDAIALDWREAAAIYNVQARKVPPLAEIYAHALHRRKELATHPDEPRFRAGVAARQ